MTRGLQVGQGICSRRPPPHLEARLQADEHRGLEPSAQLARAATVAIYKDGSAILKRGLEEGLQELLLLQLAQSRRIQDCHEGNCGCRLRTAQPQGLLERDPGGLEMQWASRPPM